MGDTLKSRLPETRSFISEHTAEFILVPDLIRRLSAQFTEVIPIFFWSTREGNSTAAFSMAATRVRILTVFARRPKVGLKKHAGIGFKLNEEVLSYSQQSMEAGISVLAGVPIVPSLFALRLNTPCRWYNLGQFDSNGHDCFIEMDSEGVPLLITPAIKPIPAPLEDVSIINIANSSHIFTWKEAVNILRSIRSACSRSGSIRFSFFGGYRPFHVVILEHECNRHP